MCSAVFRPTMYPRSRAAWRLRSTYGRKRAGAKQKESPALSSYVPNSSTSGGDPSRRYAYPKPLCRVSVPSAEPLALP